MNAEYRKYGKANFDEAISALSGGGQRLPWALESFWNVYENFLDCMNISDPEPERNTTRNRNRLLATWIQNQNLYSDFEKSLFHLHETRELANLQPRIYREETYQTAGRQDTSAHDAFSKDFNRYFLQLKCKESIPRLLDLLYTVRCNRAHGQKALPDEWPSIKERNALIFSLTVPILRKLAELLFENIWADGVFVYGTCKPNEGNFVHIQHLLGETSDGWHVEGELYDLGKYPGLVPKQGGKKVKGWFLRPKSLRELLQSMDAIEGSAFARKLLWARSAKPEEGEALAWAYCYSGPTEGALLWDGEEWHSRGTREG